MADQQAIWDCYDGYDPFSGLPVPGGLSERLWADCQQQALEALHHPFITALASGTMNRSCFQHYILQDAFFLNYFAKTYAAALDKCRAKPQQLAVPKPPQVTHGAEPPHAVPPPLSSASDAVSAATAATTAAAVAGLQQLPPGDQADCKDVLLQLLLGVHLELRMHGAYAAKWGVTLEEGLRPSAATCAYTDFLMDIAHDPQASIAEVLAAMVPCSRLYGFLGCRLAAATAGRPRHAYSEWVDTYSSADYLVSPIMKEKLFDELGKHIPYDRLKTLYSRAMQLEVNFFSAQPNMPAPRHIELLVVDFDDTATEKDTIGVLLNAAVEANVRAAPTAAAGEVLRQQLSDRIQQLSASYVAQQQQLVQELLSPAEEKAAAAAGGLQQADGAPDRAGLLNFCEVLSNFESDMNQVVIDDGCLKGLTAGDLAAAGASIKLRAGCAATIASAAAGGIPVAFLSLNWSTTLMQAALTAGAAAEQVQLQPSLLQIHANEMEWCSSGSGEAVSTGALQRHVENGRDKARAMQQLMQQHGSSSSNGSSGAVVYVGDSASDILPMLQADFGIVIGQNKLLRRALAAFGVQLKPLCSAPLVPPGSSNDSSSSSSWQQSSVLYEASNWHEIAAFLFGPNSYDQEGAGTYPGMVHVPTGRGAAAVAAAAAAAAAAAGLTAAAAAAAGVQGRGLGPPPVLTIAGSDSGGGAGIQADTKTILANGGFAMTVITALTAQNSTGVHGVHRAPGDFLEQQLDSIFSDLLPAAIKTGMLPDAAAVATVAAKLRQYIASSNSNSPCFFDMDEVEDSPSAGGDAFADAVKGQQGMRRLKLVVDPVMVSTSGHSLAAGGVGAALRKELLPLAAIITPNLSEAEALCGDGRTISSVHDMKAAAAHLHKLGCGAVLVKGGHLAEKQQRQLQSPEAAAAAAAAGSAEVQAVDVLFDGHKYYFFTAPYISTNNTHGTGCTLAAAIATALAHGQSLVEAVQSAKDYLTSVLAASVGLGLGAGPQHPFHHGAGLVRVGSAAEGSQQGLRVNGDVSGLNPSGASGAGVKALDLRMYVVTDSHCNAKAGRSLFEAVKAAVAGGATVVQIREKDLDGGDFLEETRAVIRLCRPLGVPVIINDRVDVAIAADADGVHVGQSDLPARLVRQMMGPNKILGVSVKTPAEAAKAQADGADYIGIGAVFPTGTKVSSVVGVEGVKTCVAVSGLPAVAIGGVGISNAGEVIRAGVQGLAVVSAVFAAPDVEVATRQLREAVDAALVEVQGQPGEDMQQQELVAAAV